MHPLRLLIVCFLNFATPFVEVYVGAEGVVTALDLPHSFV